MNTGQMLLTIGAMILIGVTVLSVNRTNSTHGTILRQTEVGIYATSLATSLVEEASGQNFDEVTVNDAVTNTSSLTNAGSLGAESGETTTPAGTAGFDDFDDYNNLVKIDTIRGSDIFTTRAKVEYIEPTAPNTAISTRTFHKRLTVWVTGTATLDTIKMSYIFSYFNFR